MAGEFENYNGNPVLMAARKFVTAAEDLRKFDNEYIYAALRQLEPTNGDAVNFILWLTDETYAYYERHKDH